MAASQVQGWVAIAGGLATAVIGLLGLLNYRTKRDHIASVGDAFSATVDALSDDKLTKQIAAAVLLRRFFDSHTEQGRAGQPYRVETINVIAGLLREEHNPRLQKALADGLRYARVLTNVDLQQCHLMNAYLGQKKGDDWVLDLSDADLFEARADGASLRNVTAERTVFYGARLERTVFADARLANSDFRDAHLARADFRGADLAGANFGGADIEMARFAGARNIPREVADLLDERRVAATGATVPKIEEDG